MTDSSDTSWMEEQLAKILAAEIKNAMVRKLSETYECYLAQRRKSPFRMTWVKIRECQHTR